MGGATVSVGVTTAGDGCVRWDGGGWAPPLAGGVEVGVGVGRLMRDRYAFFRMIILSVHEIQAESDLAGGNILEIPGVDHTGLPNGVIAFGEHRPVIGIVAIAVLQPPAGEAAIFGVDHARDGKDSCR